MSRPRAVPPKSPASQILPYGVHAYDPIIRATAVVVLSAFAALAGFVPTHRAASIRPMQALRVE